MTDADLEARARAYAERMGDRWDAMGPAAREAAHRAVAFDADPIGCVAVPTEREALQACHDALMKFAGQPLDAPPPWSDLSAALNVAQDTLATRSPAPSAGVDDRLDLWFFRDLSEQQRHILFALFGVPIDALLTQAAQRRALSYALQHPAAPSVDDHIVDANKKVAAEQPEARGVEGMVLVPRHYAENVGYATAVLEQSESVIDRHNAPPLRALLRFLATPNPVRAEQPEGKGAWLRADVMEPDGTFRTLGGKPVDTPATRIAAKIARDIYRHASEAGACGLTFAQMIHDEVLAAAPAAPGAAVGVGGVYALPGERVSMTWAQYVELKALSQQVDARLFDSQWVNIVNAPEVLRAESAEDAVNIAVKMTEQQMARNLADGNWPKLRPASKAQEESNG